MAKIRVAVAGYGNVGRGVLAALKNNPDMEEYRFSFDFKTNQAVITDRDDFSVVYATFERNEEREDIFVPNFEHGEDRGMLMLDYQRDLTELYDIM